ncbi:MAG: T9SS C-terminal target domain-containing protein [Haliscomenobacteraceae bacterium CHB4]|nr:T9SS C-terminal target domain-containing protein [Haliscomenobacteraceae bacterium CHB4]
MSQAKPEGGFLPKIDGSVKIVVSGVFRITGFDVSEYPDHRLILSDLAGRQVKNVCLADGGEIDVTDLPNGLYVATLWDNQSRLLSDKLVVNH